MPDSNLSVRETVFFFGADPALIETLRTRLAAQSIDLRVVRTVAGLMLAAGTRTPCVLLLELGMLPPVRSAKAILDRLEADTGIRPHLICLAAPARHPDGIAARCPEAIAAFDAPFDGVLIADRVLALTLNSGARSAREQARQTGGDRVLVHRAMDDPAAYGGDEAGDGLLLRTLQDALSGRGFQLVYQPILSLQEPHQERYEVLLRLRTPQGEIMRPATFLPVAGRHGLLPDLDRWVLSEALQTLRRERDAGRSTRLLIHQSAASLAEPDWLDWVRDEVLRLDLIRQRPVLEFTARDLLADESQARFLFPQLGKLGIKVCLAGVTDSEDVLGLIGRRPIASVKLVRELVDRGAGARLKQLVEAVRQRGAQVIATGIEDPEAIGRTRSSGADYIQGNFIQFPAETLSFKFREAAVR